MSIRLDFSSYNELRKIIELLQNKKEIKEKQWETLFATKGYETLTKSEFPKDFFRNAFSIAFSNNEDKIVEVKPNHKRFIDYYKTILNKIDLIDQQIQRMEEKFPHIENTILEKTFEFLPDTTFSHHPEVSILLFDKDARGYETIIVDVHFLGSLDALTLLLAHEFHHFYRNQLLVFDQTKIASDDEKLVWALNQIHLEGIADQIDKEFFIYSSESSFPTNFKEAFKLAVEQAPETLKEINKLFLKESNNCVLGVKILEMATMAGHPLGYYCVKKILEKGGKKELLENIGNPFLLFKSYNNYVERVFNDSTLKRIEQLEYKYTTLE